MEDDLRKRRDSLGTSLNEITKFAADLEDDLVIQAHQYDEDMAMKYQFTVNLVEKKPLDEVQNQFAELFKQWQEVVDCQSELITYIAPLQEEYNQIIVDLNNLKANCSRLEVELKRDWPPVSQNPQYVRMKVDDQEEAISRLKTIKWKRNDLRKCYLDTWQKLRDLNAEVEKLRSQDKQEVDEMIRLEQEYKNKVREHARIVYAGNDAGIRKEIETGDNFLKSLVDQYKNGQRNETNDPSASDVKARLQRKSESYKQQIVDYNINRMDDVWIQKEKSSRLVEVDIPLPINKSDFNRNIDRLLATLRKIPNASSEVEDAIQYLQSAQQESMKGTPEKRTIKGYLHSARGALDADKSISEVSTVIADISFLIPLLNTIFG
jgi:DNA repair exonuclease SbcCD ATPase subunit